MTNAEYTWLEPMTWCVDPGAVASGLANANEFYWSWNQYTEPGELYQYFYSCSNASRDTLLIEDYSHGGTFTAEAKATLEIVGFMYYSARMDGYKVHKVHKDKRLSGQGPAAVLMGGTVAELKKDPERKDAFSALSHCLVYNRKAQ